MSVNRGKGGLKNTWHVKVYMGMKNNKRDYHEETFYGTEAEANAREVEIKHEKNTGKYVAKKGDTLGDCVDTYIKNRPELAPKTIDSYRQYAGYASGLLDTPIQKISLDSLEDVSIGLQKRNKNRSAQGFVGLMRMVFRDAVRLKKINQNIAADLLTPKHKAAKWQMWDEETLTAFLKVIRCTHSWSNTRKAGTTAKCDHCKVTRKDMTPNQINMAQELRSLSPYSEAFELAMFTGLRVGEVAGLRWSNVDLEKGILTVEGQRQDINGGIFSQPKTDDGYRQLQLTPHTVELLRVWKETQNIYRMAMPELWPEDPWVISKPDGSVMRVDAINKMLKKVIRRYGFPDATFHKLRHVWATYALDSGLTRKAIQYFMGHSDPQIAEKIYQHHTKVEAEALAAMDAKFG